MLADTASLCRYVLLKPPKTPVLVDVALSEGLSRRSRGTAAAGAAGRQKAPEPHVSSESG